MEKISFVNTEKESDLMLPEITTSIYKKYYEILNQAIESYLGREFNPKLDSHRIKSVTVSGKNNTSYFVDDICIGVMSVEFGYNADDFVNSNVSYNISFTPSIL